MNFNRQEFVKDLSFGNAGREKILKGVEKLNDAVSSTLGASGRCVIIENENGDPVITKDGVTVAESIVLLDPIENLGAKMVKEAARKTVKEAGDGTTTATVLTDAILRGAKYVDRNTSDRELKNQMKEAVDEVVSYIDSITVPVKDELIDQVAIISANNDIELGTIIGSAFRAVGENGVVTMEESDTAETYVEIVDGVQISRGMKSAHFITDIEKQKAVLNDPLVLIVETAIPNIRKIQSVLEHAISSNRSILIIADMEQQPLSAVIMNKVKGNIKVLVIEPPHFGEAKREALEDLAALTGATLINEELGDDIDLIGPEHLGECIKVSSGEYDTIITVEELSEEVSERIENVKSLIKLEKNKNKIVRLEKRLAMLTGSVGVIKVGANSEIELKEKKDRVDDAIHATRAAVKGGIVPGGGVALRDAAAHLTTKKNIGTSLIASAIGAPFRKILKNAGLEEMQSGDYPVGHGVDAKTGEICVMIDKGIIDPSLVTKTALINAYSVASTILSTDCIINNVRNYETNR
jgi:chaperonin GroEL